MKPAIYVGKNNKASAVYSTGKWANANMLDNSNFQVSRYGMFAEFGGLLGDGTDFPLESQVIYPVSIYSELFFEEVPSYPIVDRWIMNIEHGVGGGYLDPVVRVGKDYEQTTPIIMYTLGGDPLQTEILLWQDINPKYYNTPYDGYDPRSGDYLGYPYLARFTLTGKFCFPLEYDSNTSISIVASLVWYANDNPNNVIGYAHNAKTINASNVDSPIVMFNGEHIEIGDNAINYKYGLRVVLSIPHSGVNYHPSAFGIEWLKLEPGSVPTPYILPDPAAEELKCSSAVWIGEQEAVMYSISATSVRGYVSFPISFMRESPMSARVEVYKKTGITKELVGSSESVPTSTVLDSDDHKLMLIVSINAISLGLTYENVSMVVTRVSVEM